MSSWDKQKEFLKAHPDINKRRNDAIDPWTYQENYKGYTIWFTSPRKIYKKSMKYWMGRIYMGSLICYETKDPWLHNTYNGLREYIDNTPELYIPVDK